MLLNRTNQHSEIERNFYQLIIYLKNQYISFMTIFSSCFL